MDMTLRSKDVSESPELLALAEEVARTDEPCVLRRGNEDVAIVTPLRTAHGKGRARLKDWRPSEEDLAKARSAFGAWKDVDTDKLLENIYASRDLPGRPPVEL